jgi:hypothetical protein
MPSVMANGRWRHAKFGRRAREAQMSGGGLECAQGIQGDVGSHAKAPVDTNPPNAKRSHCSQQAGTKYVYERAQNFRKSAPKR